MKSQPSSLLQPLYRAALLTNGAGLSDRDLLEGYILHGDGSFFEALVRRHGPMVLGVCQRVLGDRHDAEDAFQAAFLVLARRAASVIPREAVGNWLYGVAYRTALAARRAAARRRAREKQVNDMPQPHPEQEETWLELLPYLDRELDRLPAKYRAPVVLCHLEGRTRKEAAALLGLPVGTLSGRLTTAMRILAKRMSRHGLALAAPTLAAALSPDRASASLPVSLLAATVKTNPLLAASTATAGVVSAEVAALARGVLKSFLLAKLKWATVIALAIATTGGTASLLAYRTFESRPWVTQSDKRSSASAPKLASHDDLAGQEGPIRAPAEQAGRKAEDKQAQEELLQGHWVSIASEVAGEKKDADDPKLVQWRLIFKGNKVSLPGSEEVAYKNNPKKQPKELDIDVNENVRPMRAIYELKGNTLTLSWKKNGERPTDFNTAKNQSVLIVFERRMAP